jgi:hypothetical protein
MSFNVKCVYKLSFSGVYYYECGNTIKHQSYNFQVSVQENVYIAVFLVLTSCNFACWHKCFREAGSLFLRNGGFNLHTCIMSETRTAIWTLKFLSSCKSAVCVYKYGMWILSRPWVRPPSQDAPVDAGFLCDRAAWLRDGLIRSPCICSAAYAHASFSGMFWRKLDIYVLPASSRVMQVTLLFISCQLI